MDRVAPPERPAGRRVHPLVDTLAAYCWRLVVVAVVVVGLVWLVRRLWLVVAAAAVALFAARALIAPANWLRRRGAPPAVAALLVMVGLAALLGGLAVTIGAAAANEFDELGPTVERAVDDIETWVVEDAPVVDVSRAEVDELRDTARERAQDAIGASSGTIVTGARLLFEIVAGLLLAVVTTFFLLKDGNGFGQRALRLLPARHRCLVAALGGRAWTTLGGYLRGAALLGAVEAVIVGGTLLLVGAKLVAPVMVVTALGAFVPLVGAILAGVIAVLVTFATAGFGPALVVAIVAVAVQQLDNDLLAPVIYGRALQLHPLVILFSITAGGALFGPAGAITAVPLAAVSVNVVSEYRTRRGIRAEPDLVPGPATGPSDDSAPLPAVAGDDAPQPFQAAPKVSSNASRATG